MPNELACPLAYPDGKGYAFLALPSHAEFHEALRRSLLQCWAPDLPDGLQREDASFFEQLYGECRPYLDLDKALTSVDTHVKHVRDTVAFVLKLADGTEMKVSFDTELDVKLGRAKTLDSSRARPDKGDFKSSQHAVWPKAPPQPAPTNDPAYLPLLLAQQLAEKVPDAGIDLGVYTTRRNMRVVGACKPGTGVPLVPRSCCTNGLPDIGKFHAWLLRNKPTSKAFS